MRKQVFKILVVLMTSVVLTGCYGHKAIGLLQEPTKQNKLPQYEKAEYEPYRLQVNDEIIYRVITMDETLAKTLGTNNASVGSNYAVTYRIYQDGTVDIPFLRPVHLEGLTEREAQDTLQAAFRTIIPDADVKLALYNKTFTVIGDIRSGTYRIYREKMNIFQALAMSGDLMNSGDRKHVRIIRPRTNEEPEVLEFDIRTNSIVNSEYYYVYPNDVIYVARTKDSFVKVDSYTGFLGLITSSVGLLISALNFAVLFGK